MLIHFLLLWYFNTKTFVYKVKKLSLCCVYCFYFYDPKLFFKNHHFNSYINVCHIDAS